MEEEPCMRLVPSDHLLQIIGRIEMCRIPSFTAPQPTLNPTQLIIMPSQPNNNQPPSPPHIQPCTRTPPGGSGINE